MKILPVILMLSSLLYVPVTGQDIVRLVSTEICSCIDTAESLGELEMKLDSCLNVAFENVISLLDEDQQEMMSDENTIDQTVRGVSENLVFYCPKIREIVLAEKKKMHYRMSESEKAKEYYEAGVKAHEEKEHRKAEKYYLKAIRADRNWVYPLDNLGLNYRETGKNKKAIKYYARSLSIYPEGLYALINQAAAYTYMKDFEKALRNYTLLAFLYPDNPEGYFGAARVHFLTGNYEEALVYALYSLKIYTALESEYVKDSRELLSLIREKLKDQGKETLLYEKAKEFGIDLVQN